MTADLSKPKDVEHVTRTGLAAFGRIDILVTNAGGAPVGPFESHSAEALREAVRLNLASVLNLTRAVLPGMKERRWGRIINDHLDRGEAAGEGLILSNCVRAAVHGFAKTLANDVAPCGVTVNNVLPGHTGTRWVEGLTAATAERKGITEADAFRA